MTTDETIPGYTPKPISFEFDEKLAPRLGAIYDVFGDSSLKVFASFGIYYDVMKLYMAEGAYGGFKWQTSYYDLDNYNWPSIADTGVISDASDQADGGDYQGSRDWRHRSFGDETDPNMLPISQSEFSFGAEKKLTEELSFSARGVYKHLIRTIEDIGYLLDGSEAYVIGNPGIGASRLDDRRRHVRPDTSGPAPRPRESTTASTWPSKSGSATTGQGGVNYTWSQTKGNYGGLYSSDEAGRQGPNVDRYFDLWFERYDLYGNPLDGILPSDRTHYFKVFGSYSFPFGLTAGFVAYGRSGLPRTTMFGFNDVTSVANGYGDLGRTPFLFTTDVYVEYNLKLGSKYNLNLNAHRLQRHQHQAPSPATWTTPTRTPGTSATTPSSYRALPPGPLTGRPSGLPTST